MQIVVLYAPFCNESPVFTPLYCNVRKRIIHIYAHSFYLRVLLSMKNALKIIFLPERTEMPRGTFHKLSALPGYIRTGMRARMLMTVLCIAFVGSILAACGASATAMQSAPSPPTTHMSTPTPKPSPTHVPTPQPMPTQVSTSTPTPVQAAPAVLDLR